MRAVHEQEVLDASSRILLAQPIVLVERARHRVEQDQPITLAARESAATAGPEHRAEATHVVLRRDDGDFARGHCAFGFGNGVSTSSAIFQCPVSSLRHKWT